jgi:multimeric flavodoxin WrbA
MYWSSTGNTKRVAETIERTLRDDGVEVTLVRTGKASEVDLLAYDLVFFGAPPYWFSPPRPVFQFVMDKMKYHEKCGDVMPRAPQVPGRRAVIFCTYSGPHSALDEATPVVKYMGQLFVHLGFAILGEWYVVGEFHGDETLSTKGHLGDIRGRPDENDLGQVAEDVRQVVRSITKENGQGA